MILTHLLHAAVATRAPLVTIAGCLLCVVQTLYAQTGKVEGTVQDPAGQPVASAQVVIDGTSFSATTSRSGYYFLNNVPAGTYTLRSQYIGFAPTEIRNVRVLAEQTMTVSFRLQGVVQLDQINVVAQANPLVPRDQVTSKPIVSGEEIDQLPVDDVRAVLRLQPGVVESENDLGLSIRGGRPGQSAVYVDGVPIRSQQNGLVGIDIGTNALEEASITTGAVSSEYGDQRSGVIEYVTKAGGRDLSGAFSYATDEPFGSSSFGINRFEASLGGPLADRLTFYVSGTLQGNADAVTNWGADTVPTYVAVGYDTTVTLANDPGNALSDSTSVSIPHFVQYGGACSAAANEGYPCQGRRRPWGFNTQLRAQGKLQYTYGRGSRVSLTYLNSTTQTRDHNEFNPSSNVGSRDVQNAYILNWVQDVLHGAEHAMTLDLYASYQKETYIAGTLTPASELASRDPPGGVRLAPLDFIINFDHFSDDIPGMYAADSLAVTTLNTQRDWDQLIDNWRTKQGTRIPYQDRRDLVSTQPYRFNPWGLESGVPTYGGTASTAALYQERRLYGRGNVDWQLDRYNRFKLGGEVAVERINFFGGSTSLSTRRSASTIDQIFDDAYSAPPVKAALYGEDRVDLGDVVLVLGIRWDQFDARTLFENLRDTLQPRIASQTHHALTPHLQVSFPVTDKTDFRLSYSQAVQSPDLNAMLASQNNRNSNGEGYYGGDVDYGKTIAFEFGIRHAFSQDMIVDVSAYNRNVVGDLAYRIEGFYANGMRYTRHHLTNADFGYTRGVDFQIIRRIGNVFNGQVSYTYSTAKNTGSDPYSYLNGLANQLSQVTGMIEPPSEAASTTKDNRPHNIAGAFSLHFPDDFAPGHWYGSVLQDGGIFATFRFASGLPYTPCVNKAVGTYGPGNRVCRAPADQLGPANSARMPWVKYFDLRVNKGLSIGPTDWTVFLDVRNLFNFRNLSGLFIETGDIANQKYETEQYVQRAIFGVMAKAPSSRIVNVASGDSTVQAVDLRPGCSQKDWGSVTLTANCYVLQQVESRFGNGDGVLDVNEQFAAFDAAYQAGVEIRAPWEFLQHGREIRAGVEIAF